MPDRAQPTFVQKFHWTMVCLTLWLGGMLVTATWHGPLAQRGGGILMGLAMGGWMWRDV